MNIYFNALGQSSALLDTIEDMQEAGVIRQGLKSSAKNFNRQMVKFIDESFQHVPEKDKELAQAAFSVTHQLIGAVCEMGIEEQNKLLKQLRNG